MNRITLCFILTFLSIGSLNVCHSNGFDITVIHTNDVHGRFKQFTEYGTECSEQNAANTCFGGVARRMTKVRDIRSNHGNVLFLDAGDHFLGRVMFTCNQGAATALFMNELHYDVMVGVII